MQRLTRRWKARRPLALIKALNKAIDKPMATESSIASSSREELIRQAAHRRFLARGSKPGGELQDWLDAEAEINQSRGVE